MNKTTTHADTSAQPASPPQDPVDGGSYRRNADGSLTLLHATAPGPHDGRRRAERPDQSAQDTNNAAHQE